MPITTKKKPDPNTVYIAGESVSFGHHVINAGDRRRGSDPLVAEHFEYWRPDGTPIQRVPTIDPPPAANYPRRPPYDALVHEKLITLDAVVLRLPLRVARAQDTHVEQLPVGTVVRRDAEIVRLAPDAFQNPKEVVKR